MNSFISKMAKTEVKKEALDLSSNISTAKGNIQV